MSILPLTAEASLYKSSKSYINMPGAMHTITQQRVYQALMIDLDEGYFLCMEELCQGKVGRTYECCQSFCECVWSPVTNTYVCWEQYEKCVGSGRHVLAPTRGPEVLRIRQ